MSTHGTYAYYQDGCHCADCRKASADYQRETRAQKQALSEGAPHGTINGYFNWVCRCERCKATYSEYMKAYRAYVKTHARQP